SEARASEAGKRLKDNHRIVFSILLSDHRAVGVYDIAARSEAHGKRLQPVQIYRALETLMELGSVHRVESANAYVACHSNHACRRPQILICTACDRVSEMDSPKVQNALEQASLENGFVMTQQNIELRGLCPNCTDQPNP
ncbi:MAG: transcriptional repressor, partial [Pseudomonadota bacterium]